MIDETAVALILSRRLESAKEMKNYACTLAEAAKASYEVDTLTALVRDLAAQARSPDIFLERCGLRPLHKVVTKSELIGHSEVCNDVHRHV
jgi:hypothetical protein